MFPRYMPSNCRLHAYPHPLQGFLLCFLPLKQLLAAKYIISPILYQMLRSTVFYYKLDTKSSIPYTALHKKRLFT